MSQNNKAFFGFHISRDAGTVREPKGPVPIEVGKTYKATGRIKLCAVGVHASETIVDAARYRLLSEGRIVSFVKVWGDVRRGDNKIVGRYRKVLAKEKIRNVPVAKCGLIHDGHSKPCTDERVDRKWILALERRLVAAYNRNKKKIDATEEMIILSR